MAEETAAATETAKPKGGMKKTIGLVVIGLGLGLLVGKMFLFKSEPASTAVVVESPVTTVFSRLEAVSVKLDSITVNLEAGHYAKVDTTVFFSMEAGAALGAEAKAEVLKPKLAKISSDIDAFLTGKSPAEVNDPAFKVELRNFLMEEAEVDYEGAIADIQILAVAQ